MPRSVQDILARADDLAKQFEAYEPTDGDEREVAAFTTLREAVMARSAAERTIREAVDNARDHGYSWTLIGSILGTSGEAVRQRYGHKQQA